jgi:hypothetical protein
VANITNNTIHVVLSGPPNASGLLRLTVTGPSATQVVDTGVAPQGPGTYSHNFGLASIPVGQYTTVTATWTVGGAPYSGTASVSFNAMGTYRHSQYNTPNESSCTGPQAAAYRTSASCDFTATTLRSDFIDQSWLNGSGITISFGPEQNEAWCLLPGHGNPPADASGRSFRPTGSILGSCGLAVGNDTVAKGDDETLLTCGDQILIVGLGAGTGTVKTVTDRCAQCTGQNQLDNYTTLSACVPRAILDLGYFRTIRLR